LKSSIILFEPSENLFNVICLNILIENLKKTKYKEIILVVVDNKLEESLFINFNYFDQIIRLNNVKDVVKNLRRFSLIKEKIVIDLSQKLFFYVFGNLIFNKQSFIKVKRYDIKNIRDILKKNKLILNNNFSKFINKPKIFIENKELKKAKKYINWSLNSSLNKNLDEIKFLYILINEKETGLYHQLFIKLKKLLKFKNNLKIIITTTSKHTSRFDVFLKNLDPEIKKIMIGKEFFKSDKNFITTLIKKSIVFITDNMLYYHYSDHLNQNKILLRRSENSKKNQFEESFQNELELFKDVI